jgi:hypothetical protein
MEVVTRNARRVRLRAERDKPRALFSSVPVEWSDTKEGRGREGERKRTTAEGEPAADGERRETGEPAAWRRKVRTASTPNRWSRTGARQSSPGVR